MKSFPRVAALLAFVIVPLAAACGGEVLSVGSDALHQGDGGGGGADGGKACKVAADCGPDAECGFGAGAVCSAYGSCFSTAGMAVCAAYSPGCACDGETINVACNGLPSGFTTKPLAHADACTTSGADAGGPCGKDSDCGPQAVCGFPQADACGATGTCFRTAGGAMCAAFSAGCACDGTETNLVCNGLPSDYAPKPLRHAGACVDGG